MSFHNESLSDLQDLNFYQFANNIRHNINFPKIEVVFICYMINSELKTKINEILFGTDPVLKRFENGPKVYTTSQNEWELMKWNYFPGKEASHRLTVVYREKQALLMFNETRKESKKKTENMFRKSHNLGEMLSEMFTIESVSKEIKNIMKTLRGIKTRDLGITATSRQNILKRIEELSENIKVVKNIIVPLEQHSKSKDFLLDDILECQSQQQHLEETVTHEH